MIRGQRPGHAVEVLPSDEQAPELLRHYQTTGGRDFIRWLAAQPSGPYSGPTFDLAEARRAQALRASPVPKPDEVTTRRKLGSCAVLLACTGWGDDEVRATMRAAEAARACGALRLSVIVTQNLAEAGDATMRWKPPAHLARYVHRQVVRNDGYAAACNAGASALPGQDWYLYTQADCAWEGATLEAAIRLSASAKRDGGLLPPLVGPSGGYVMDTRHVAEQGRNIGQSFAPRVADFLAGYWVIAPGELVRRVDWDVGFFLYYEDPDYCLRAALAGSYCIVQPGLEVDHRRGQTIGDLFHSSLRSEIQSISRARFVARWPRA